MIKDKLEEPSYSPEETARRRDEVIRRMANTPPQPNGKPKRRRGKRKPTASGRVARKVRAASGKAP